MSDNRTQLLVLGPARSGTTLLCSIIGSHPEVRMMNECESHEYSKQIGGSIVGNKLCVPNHITLNSKGPILKRPVSPKSKLAKFADFLRWLTGHQKPPAISIRDYINNWDAKLIIIIRSPDHVIHSIHRRGGKTNEIARYRWAEAITTISTLVNEYPNRTFLTSFEQLVNNPRDVTSKICDFLDIIFKPEMLKGYKKNQYYSLNSIDSSVATKEVPSSNIEVFYPEALKMYNVLNSKLNKQAADERNER